MRLEPVEGPEVWVAADLERDRDWIVDLDAGEQAEALAALAPLLDRPLESIEIEDFPLPTLAARLDKIIDQIEGGRGVCLIRGAPIAGLAEPAIARLFWALSLHVGVPEPQDGAQNRLHHVRAERAFSDPAEAKAAFRDTNIRGYQTNLELNFHGDGSDALFFLCVRDAPEGGLSRIASAGAAFNRVLAARQDLAEALQEPYAFDTRGELGPDRPFQLSPIFQDFAGRMNMLYKRGYIELAQHLPDAPKLTGAQREAMDLLDQVLADPELYYEFKLNPGDVEIANNYNVLHARTKFVDHPDPDKGRHMLRIWSTLRRNRRPLPPAFRDSREFGASHRRRVALGDLV